MLTIDRIPKKARVFFRPLQKHFTEPAWGHFWALVMAITVSHGATIDRLVKTLRGSTHRTNHGEFLWRSAWEESQVIREMALDTLKRLYAHFVKLRISDDWERQVVPAIRNWLKS